MLLHLILALLLATPSGLASTSAKATADREAERHVDGPGPTRVLDLAGSSVNPLVLAPRRHRAGLHHHRLPDLQSLCPLAEAYAAVGSFDLALEAADRALKLPLPEALAKQILVKREHYLQRRPLP